MSEHGNCDRCGRELMVAPLKVWIRGVLNRLCDTCWTVTQP